VSASVCECNSERNPAIRNLNLVVGSKISIQRFKHFYFTLFRLYASLLIVRHTTALRKRDRLAASLPCARDILRGSLLQRVIRHRSGCPKCERGEGHPVAVLAIGYPGARIRQICLRKDQVPYVKRCLASYQKLKATIERICELNQELLRIEPGDKEGQRRK
jgi:hypothetical protein